MPGDASLARLFRDHEDRWEIERIERGCEWVAVQPPAEPTRRPAAAVRWALGRDGSVEPQVNGKLLARPLECHQQAARERVQARKEFQGEFVMPSRPGTAAECAQVAAAKVVLSKDGN